MTKHSWKKLVVAACTLAACVVMPATAGAATFEPGFQEINAARGLDADRDAALDKIKGAGSDVLRITVSWKTVAANCNPAVDDLDDPNEDCYSWWLVDPIVSGATAKGVSILATHWMFPTWATGNSDWKYTGADWAAFQSVADNFALFAKAMAIRYAPGSPHGTIGMYTIGNEPGSNDFWLPDTSDRMTRFAYLYKGGATAIRAGSPTALIAPGPTGPKSLPVRPLDFIDGFQTAMEGYGATGLVDAWAHNTYAGGNISPYTSYLAPPSVGIGNISDLFAKLDESPITNGVPVWSTEFAYQTNPPDATGTTPEKQAAWAAQALDVAESSGRIPYFYWYVLMDPTDPNDWDSGFYYADGSEKPGLAMWRRPVAMTSTSRLVNGKVRVYGRSNVGTNPRLVYRIGSGGTWANIPGQTGVPAGTGGLYAYIAPNDGLQVAVQDDQGMGPVLTQTANEQFTDQVGGSGTDKINGGNGADVIDGGGGNDTLNGGNGDDLIDGGKGNDQVIGGAGNDQVSGGEGNDKVSGGDGNDKTDGGKGNDKVDGGKGNDKVSGGEGNDDLRGGEGNDQIDATEGELSKSKKRKRKCVDRRRKNGKKYKECKMRPILKFKDNVFCGTGNDSAKVDYNDVVAKDCEKVTYAT